MLKSKTVEEFISNNEQWAEALSFLRTTLLDSDLVETVKWGSPVYTYQNKNIVGIGGFKSYVGLWFYQGALLLDEQHKLINAQEGVTKALRQWRFDSLDEIKANEDLIMAYTVEAIQNQIDGKEIKPKSKKELKIPSELLDLLSENPVLKMAFEQFTPFKQREFSEYIEDAKRTSTKQKRLEKITPMILIGEGLNDKYRK